MIPTRLPKTNKQYAIKAKTVRSQAAHAHGHASPYTVPATTVVEHLISRKPTISRNTWKQYKCALRQDLESQLAQTKEKVITEDLQVALRTLNAATSEGALKYGTQTSSRKQKGIRRADYEKLITYLELHIGTHKYARTLLTWLQATRIAGLRPSEWEHATITGAGKGTLLIVRNAKATNGRGHGEERTLDIGAVDAGDLASLHDMVGMVEGYRSQLSFAELQLHVGDYMKYAARRCFGKRKQYPTLYSLRHQWSANAKSSGHSKADVAAMMGHGSDATAGSHYGRAVSGDSAVKIKPLAAEVARVKPRARTFVPGSSRSPSQK